MRRSFNIQTSSCGRVLYYCILYLIQSAHYFIDTIKIVRDNLSLTMLIKQLWLIWQSHEVLNAAKNENEPVSVTSLPSVVDLGEKEKILGIMQWC